MMNKLMTFIVAVAILMASTSVAFADGQNCVTNYGGTIVCPTTPPSPTVNAGLEDINPVTLGAFALITSGILFLASKRKAVAIHAVITTMFVLSTLFVMPTVVSADGQNCVTNYGGTIVCPTTPPSPTVNAGIEEIFNPLTLSTILFGLSGGLFVFSKSKVRASK